MSLIAPTRLSWLDRAKGLCIALVVFGHALRGDESAGITIDRSFFEWTDSILYAFHMPAFFLLAGITYYGSYQRKGAQHVAIAAIASVLYPFVLWSLVQGAIHSWVGDYTNFPSTLSGHYRLFTNPRAQFWFLHALFFMYLISIFFLRRWPSHPIWAVLPAAVLLYFLSPLLSHTLLGPFALNWIFFAAGIVVSSAGLKRPRVRSLPLVLSVIVVFLSLAIERGNVYAAGPTRVENLAVAFAGIALVLCLARSLEGRGGSVLELLGVFSLEIYLMHILAASGTRIVLLHLLGVTAPVVHLVAATAAGIVVPLGIAVWLKRRGIGWPFRFPIRGAERASS